MQHYLGNNENDAVATVLATLPAGTLYKVVAHGQDNLIVIAAGNVYRFPRNQAVWERSGIEQFVLEKLRDHPELPVPHLKAVRENPAYTIAAALDGEVLENEIVRTLPPTAQQKIGRQIGSFAASFHGVFSPSDIRKYIRGTAPQARYARYLHTTLATATPNDAYFALAQSVSAAWPQHDHSETTVIHDDLHLHNMLFDAERTLTGVLDFGDVNLGDPEQDLRYVYWMGDTVMDNAVAAYEQQSGRPIDRTLLKLCAISQELTGLYDSERSYMHARAKANLDYREADLPML